MKGNRQQRITVLHEVARGHLTATAAAAVLGVSERQVWRLLAAYRQRGAPALQHGNTGRQPAHTISAAVRRRVVALAQTTYQGCNEHHLGELLAEREGLTRSRSSLRRIRRAAGIGAARPPATPTPRQRRARYPRAGMLVQIDASPHDWLEGRGPRLTLLAAIDDATNEVPAALFRRSEDAHGYFLLLERLVTAHGRPLALYHDRHGIFQPNPKRPWSVEEHLAGRAAPTQFGRLLAGLEITAIAAQSPQAKGRAERLFGTLQDRLVSELRLAGAATLDAATAVLVPFLPEYNRRFAVPAAETGSAYRPLDPTCRPETIFCFKYQRMVAADNRAPVWRPARPRWRRRPRSQHRPRLRPARRATRGRPASSDAAAAPQTSARPPLATPEPPPRPTDKFTGQTR